MKRLLKFSAVLFLLLLFTVSAFGATVPFSQLTKTVKFSGGSRTVTSVMVNLNDPTVRFEEVTAQGVVGRTEELAGIAKRAANGNTEVIAAINGTFFSAYSATDFQPYGDIIDKGELVHAVSSSGSFAGFTVNNRFVLENLYYSIDGSTDGNWEYPYNWFVYAVNHRVDSDYMLTPRFGTSTGNCGSSTIIVVKSGVVAAITKGQASIPPDGYVLVFKTTSIAQRFKVGQKVDYRITYNSSVIQNGKVVKGNPLDMSLVRTGLSAGPTLLKNSVIYADGIKEGITENKMNTLRGARSFIGVTKDNMLIMGTVPNVTVKELAEIVKGMGLVNAMNLDGGASSGLYYQGKYLTTPGRKLSNALVVTKLKVQPKRIILNNKEVLLEADPFMTNGTTMVPLDNLTKEMGIRLEKDSSGVTLYKGDDTLKLCYNSTNVEFNREAKSFSPALITQYGKPYMPIRALEFFGANIKSDAAQNAIIIQMEVVKPLEAYTQAIKASEAGNKDLAEALLLKAVEADPGLSCALLRLYKIYFDKQDWGKEIIYLNKYLEIEKGDVNAAVSLGWALMADKRYDEALAQFIKVTEMKPNDPSAFVTVGDIYSYTYFSDPQKSREYYEKALSLNPDENLKAKILQKIANLKY